VIGNIHSGECAGKEALLMLLRELSESAQHAWLEHATIVFVPNYNADANDKMELTNRPGQIGPVRGMGQRANSQGFDLNRDFMKLESPEARALVRLMTEFDPHLFIDCHTTNGSKHRYQLTYDVPHNPATAPAVRNYLRQQMMPRVTELLEQQGTATFYYGNFDDNHAKWVTYGYEPRYSTEYYGLRGRLAILSEAYSYIPFKERILATKAFVTACIEDTIAHREVVVSTIATVDAEQQRAAATDTASSSLSLAAEIQPFSDPVRIRGFKDGQPFEHECIFLGDYRSTNDTPLPVAWLVPDSLPQVAQLLQAHGVRMSQLTMAQTATVEVDTITELKQSTRAFQQHYMQRAAVTRTRQKMALRRGTWVVPANQPLGRLAGYLLESESCDGIVTWNVIDDALNVDQPYPVMRLVEPLAAAGQADQ
jgi:dipeptidyl-peptidase-4